MKQNLGKLDRIFRFLLGAWWISPWQPMFACTWVNWIIFIAGWWMLIESFIAYCPLFELLKINNRKQ